MFLVCASQAAAALFDGCAERIKACIQIHTTDTDGYVACADAIKSAGECRGSVCAPEVYNEVVSVLMAALQIDQNCSDGKSKGGYFLRACDFILAMKAFVRQKDFVLLHKP